MKHALTLALALIASLAIAAQNAPKADESCYTYEPQTDTTFSIEGVTPFYILLANGFSELDLYTDTYGSYMMFLPHTTGFSGHYTCSVDEDHVHPGEFAYSAGVSNGAIFQSFVAVVNNGYFNITDYNVYFVVDGEVDINLYGDSLEVTGQYLTYWGSTINIHYKGLAPADMVETALDNTSASALRLFAEGRVLRVESEEPYDLYTISGQHLYHGDAGHIQLPFAGAYIVRTATEAQKIVVK